MKQCEVYCQPKWMKIRVAQCRLLVRMRVRRSIARSEVEPKVNENFMTFPRAPTAAAPESMMIKLPGHGSSDGTCARVSLDLGSRHNAHHCTSSKSVIERLLLTRLPPLGGGENSQHQF